MVRGCGGHCHRTSLSPLQILSTPGCLCTRGGGILGRLRVIPGQAGLNPIPILGLLPEHVSADVPGRDRVLSARCRSHGPGGGKSGDSVVPATRMDPHRAVPGLGSGPAIPGAGSSRPEPGREFTQVLAASRWLLPVCHSSCTGGAAYGGNLRLGSRIRLALPTAPESVAPRALPWLVGHVVLPLGPRSGPLGGDIPQILRDKAEKALGWRQGSTLPTRRRVHPEDP
jgi:hypothetical protein